MRSKVAKSMGDTNMIVCYKLFMWKSKQIVKCSKKTFSYWVNGQQKGERRFNISECFKVNAGNIAVSHPD